MWWQGGGGGGEGGARSGEMDNFSMIGIWEFFSPNLVYFLKDAVWHYYFNLGGGRGEGGRGEVRRGEVRRGDNLNFIGILKFFSLWPYELSEGCSYIIISFWFQCFPLAWYSFVFYWCLFLSFFFLFFFYFLFNLCVRFEIWIWKKL